MPALVCNRTNERSDARRLDGGEISGPDRNGILLPLLREAEAALVLHALLRHRVHVLDQLVDHDAGAVHVALLGEGLFL